MTKEDKDKINKQLTQIRNVTILMRSLFRTVGEHMRDFHCDEDEAIDRIEKAYDFLKKYGIIYLEDAERNIREITDKEYNNANNVVNNILAIGNKL